MGSICSKRNSTHYVGGREVLGGSGTGGSDPQSAAALAAARRQKEAQKRGINEANPKAGQLSAKVEAAKSVERTRAADAEERLVWD